MRLHKRPSVGEYVLLGVCTGLGILSKYSFGVFALALALARPQSRRIHAALQGTGAAERSVIERFLKAMVNSESVAQIDSLPDKVTGAKHGDQ